MSAERMPPAAVFVIAVVRAVHSLDWHLARRAALAAFASHAVTLWDAGHDVEFSEAPQPIASVHALRFRSDLDERIQRRATK